MMNDPGKSDSPIVPRKSPNNTDKAAAEGMEGRGWPRGTRESKTRSGRRAGPARTVRSSGYARQRGKTGSSGSPRSSTTSTTSIGCGKATLPCQRKPPQGSMARRGAATERTRRKPSGPLGTAATGAYRALRSSGRISEAGRGQRPIGLPVLEDKIVQRSVCEVLTAVYDREFFGFSYGFRQGRDQHQALAALRTALLTKKVNWVLDADLRRFLTPFDTSGWSRSSSTGSGTGASCG